MGDQSQISNSPERVEDAALLTGRGRFFDDFPADAGTVHAAILRSAHAHARILSIDVSAAKALTGVTAVLLGSDIASITSPLMVGVKLPIECWPIAIDKVRYVGEPVAVVLACDRYVAEDALDLINVGYEPLPPVVEPEAAIDDAAAVLHDAMGSNLGAERRFRYGDPESAFSAAEHVIEIKIRYPRSSCTPIETYGVAARYDPHEGCFDIFSSFQGPFSIQPVIARALKTAGPKVRLRTPDDSGGSFGVKQGVFPYIVLLAACARLADCPVRWVEDRLEHLTASVSATNRVTTLRAAVSGDGRVSALDWDQIEDVGAYLRAPEPATLYRMQGNMCGAYDIPNLAIRNRIVMTSKTPTGLNRGFGGPQVYFALERLMQRIAVRLKLDPLDVIGRNLVRTDAFPYRTASGAVYDSGDYQAALDTALDEGGYDALLAKRDKARAEGRLYGIGLAAVVEPSVSNMGYLSTALTPEARARAGPKNGAQAVATISLDPSGGVTILIDSVPQGQGHRTVAAMVAGDVLGLEAAAVRVISTLDTGKDAWSIAAGNYSSRFAAASVGAVKIAAERLRTRLARIAAGTLNAEPHDLVFDEGRIAIRGNPDASLPIARVASAGHWAPATVPDDSGAALRETVFWTPPELTAPTPQDGINSSLCHAFIFDFCGVEIDAMSGDVRVDRYVTMHDCGTVLHAGMVEGQIRGGFAHAVGAALLEEYAYGADGAFLAGTFADYPAPTVHEVPDLQILHVTTPSPVTPLGAKGVGEGNCMSTPVCIANAVADAFAPAFGSVDLELPLTASKLAPLLGEELKCPPDAVAQSHGDAGPGIRGDGRAFVPMPPDEVWKALTNPVRLSEIVPGARRVEKTGANAFVADVSLRVGPVGGDYLINVNMTELDMTEPETTDSDCAKLVRLSGRAVGALGSGEGTGTLSFNAVEGGTEVHYTYETSIGGKVAAVGSRLLNGAARIVIGRFFAALARGAGGNDGAGRMTWLRRLVGRRS